MTNPIPEPRNEGPVYGEITVQKDAANRGWRTLGQSVLAAVLTFLGALGADMAMPGFELDYETTAFGLAFVALTPVLAYLQRRAGK